MGVRRTASQVAVLTSALLAAALLSPTSAPAAPTPSVTLDLATLTEGPPPAMPYFDSATKQIRDGARVVDLSGLKKFTRSTWLWKVSGGYVLDRFVKYDLRADENHLLFVSNAGKAIVLSRHLETAYRNLPVVVSSRYGRVVYAEVVNRHTSLVVNDVPSGRRVSARSVQPLTRPVAYRGRVLARHLSRAFYWKPGVTAVETDHDLDGMLATDLRAGQSAYQGNAEDDRVAPYPPGTGEGWSDPELNLINAAEPPVTWSTDQQRLASPTYTRSNQHTWDVVHLRRAADGAPVLDIVTGGTTQDGQVFQLWWENADTVLMRFTTNPGQGFATVRCTVTGACNRIGAVSPVPSVVPATRNVS